MWTLPTKCELTPLWETLEQNSWFLLQKSRGADNLLWKSVVDTLQNVFDTKQLPYRILWIPSGHVWEEAGENSRTAEDQSGEPDSKSGINGNLPPHALVDPVKLVACAGTLDEIRRDWQHALKLSKDAKPLAGNSEDLEAFFMTKIQSLVAASAEETAVDEAAPDEKFRQAARSYRRQVVLWNPCFLMFILIVYFVAFFIYQIPNVWSAFTRVPTKSFRIRDGCTFRKTIWASTPMYWGQKPKYSLK